MDYASSKDPGIGLRDREEGLECGGYVVRDCGVWQSGKVLNMSHDVDTYLF